MKKIKITVATAGLKLAKPVENEADMVLYGAGMEITDQMLTKLKALNIETVYVEGAGELRFPKNDYLNVVNKAFLKVGNNAAMGRLKQAMNEHIETIYNNQ